MSPPPVKVRIGGELDPSLARSLATASQQIDRAAKQSQKYQKDTTKSAEQEAKAQLRAQQQLAKATDSLDRQRARALYEQYRAQEAGAERAAKAQERAVARAQAAERREIEKTIRLAQRAFEEEARQQARARAQSLDRFATRTSHRTTRFLMPEAPIGPMVMRGLGDVARGAGIDFSIQGMVKRNVDLEAAAVDLSNSGYQAGTNGANGRRVAASELIGQARAVGGQFGIDASEVLAGLAQYQKIAGDLDTGRQSLLQMAALSKATGTNLADMAAATANVSNGLGDVPDKARIIDEVMRTIAGQGKLGAVEISDMATQMARIAAAASNFGGDRAKNIMQFGALAQIARAEGGAPSAAEAARSMGGFANTFKKAARDKEFNAIVGKTAYTDSSHTTLRDPIELIKDALRATKGDQLKMNKIFMDVVGGRTVTGLAKAYTGAGGGDAGMKAVDDLIARMMKAQISEQEQADSAKRAAETAQAKAARFQNSLDSITESTMKNLVPALEDAGPAVLHFADVIGKVSTWAAVNPKSAVATAIAASVARAGLESTLRAGLENVIKGAAGGLPGKGFGGGIGVLGNLSAALTITALSVGAFEAGKLIINSEIERLEKGQRDAAVSEATAGATEAAIERRQRGGTYKTEDEKFVSEREKALRERINQATWRKDVDAANGGAPTGWKLALEQALNPDVSKAREDAQHLDELKAEMTKVHDMLTKIQSGTLRVEVTNPTEGGGGDYDAPVTGHRVSN